MPIASVVSGHIKKNMETDLQNIDENDFGNDLNKSLIKLRVKYPDSNLINAFIMLCKLPLDELFQNDFAEEILDDYSKIERYKNTEILARWREYLSIRFKNEKQTHLKIAVSLFIDTYNSTCKTKYLKHALLIVKTYKNIFSDELENIYEEGKKAVLNSEIPFTQKEILIELTSLYPEKVKLDFATYLKDRIKKHTLKQDFLGVTFLIESLKVIKVINQVDYKIMLAENYEHEGDYLSEDKKPNTYYPTILLTYQKGLRELKSIKCNDDLRKRLEVKVLEEQKDSVNMFAALANCYTSENEYRNKIINDFGDNCISLLNIYDFASGFKGLLSFPISFDGHINKTTNNKYFFSEFFDQHERINSKGRVVGISSSEEAELIYSRNFWRECVINFIKKTKSTMDEDRILSREKVFDYLFKKCKSNFIPEDRKWLFAEGIYAGFSNDFISSSHILVPQIENSLKYIVEQNGLLTAKIYDEIQHDNMLGGLLGKLTENNGHSIFNELKDFLIENCSVNFRNEMCHGLLSPIQIDHYGIYVWWLCLKMIYDREKIFDNKNTTR